MSKVTDDVVKAAYLLGRKQWCPASILLDEERTERDWQKAKATLSHSPVEQTPARHLSSDVQWVTNDIAELGVKIGNQFFFLYKGESLVYGALDPDPTIPPVHGDGTPMQWRPVFKREFGECAHPINYDNPKLIGKVSLDDSDQWKPLPAPSPTPAPPVEQESGAGAEEKPSLRLRVKPLEWIEHGDLDFVCHRANPPIGPRYNIEDDGFSEKKNHLTVGQLVLGNFETLEEAKTVAQADYESRVLSAIEGSGL